MLQQYKIFEKGYGEVFICSDQTHGAMEVLEHFKGKLIASFGGGCKKLFVTEEQSDDQGVVSCLHAEEFDDYDYTFSDPTFEPQSPEDVISAFNAKGQIKSLICGKRHIFLLNDKGQLFSYGFGEYGSLGQGGTAYLQSPKIIPALRDRFVVQVACGEFHSLALTNIGDVYSWGRGFEGQLGISKEIETSSTPKYIKYFHKIPVKLIACGSYHSLAISQEKKLYGWGEARLGQLSFPKKNKLELPQQIKFTPFQKEVTSQFNLNPINYDYEENYIPEIKLVAGGYGHTIALSELGDLYVFGFNIKGQLGLGDRKNRYTPEMLRRDILNQKLPKFKHVACGYYNNFAVTENGKVMSWGFGNLGQKNETIQDLPRLVETHVEGRSFSSVFMNQNSTLLLAPLRVSSVRPFCGPSLGRTMISLIGTGFKDTGKQIIRFKFSDYQVDIKATYDNSSDCFHAMTPNFESFRSSDQLPLQWPQNCKIQLSLDGFNFTDCENDFLIYNSKIQVNSLNIKCASVQGGMELQLHVNNIDEITAQSLEYLIVGFQLKKRNAKESKNEHNTSVNSKMSRAEKQQEKKEVKTINPLDASVTDVELDKENWKCMPGFYEKGTIICTIPNVEQYQGSQLNFNVDISLNGQQFTGYPSSFKFYNIQNTSISPTSGSPQGGLNITATGNAFFDTLQKKVKFSCKYGDRIIDPVWDQVNKSFTFVAPPLEWLFGGNEHTQEQIQNIMNDFTTVSLSLNGVEWINIGKFYFFEPEVDWIGYTTNFTDLNDYIKQEQKSQESMTQNQLDQDKENQINEFSQSFKKAHQYITLNGFRYTKVDQILVKFICQNVTQICNGHFITASKVLVQLPDLNLATGANDVIAEICFNGQQFSDSQKTFRYLAFQEGVPEKDRLKIEDDLSKSLKKKK